MDCLKRHEHLSLVQPRHAILYAQLDIVCRGAGRREIYVANAFVSTGDSNSEKVVSRDTPPARILRFAIYYGQIDQDALRPVLLLQFDACVRRYIFVHGARHLVSPELPGTARSHCDRCHQRSGYKGLRRSCENKKSRTFLPLPISMLEQIQSKICLGFCPSTLGYASTAPSVYETVNCGIYVQPTAFRANCVSFRHSAGARCPDQQDHKCSRRGPPIS